MSNKPKHDFHLVDPSPWPFIASLSAFIMLLGAVALFHNGFVISLEKLNLNLEIPVSKLTFPIGVVLLLFTASRWWKDTIKEGLKEHHHTNIVRIGLRMGMALFILSEVMFFFAFFWSFFKASIFPVHILEGVWPIKDGIWPPAGIETFDPWHIPLLNTLILLLSGTTVTWAHHAILNNNKSEAVKALIYTVILGASFTCFQVYEYIHATFKFTDGIYASNFYMATGFHGFHVLVGTIFLAVCLFRANKGQFSPDGHLGFEFASWYWHFVDVVWLFLYIFVYIWGR